MKKNDPLVSIITVTRNRAQLIGRCIESIQKQIYTNYEHIIIDGASEDNTKEIVESYSDDKRVVYIQLNKNLPIPKTIWHAFEQSRGDYITFLDDDDEYLSSKIEKQVLLIQTLPESYGMVYCWMSYFDEITKEFLKIHKPTLRGFVAEDVVEKPTVSGTPTFFIKREVFHEVGGWKDKDEIGIISDWELSARICQKWKVDYVSESLVNVYINHGFKRMSDNGYYKSTLEKSIKFHQYFLSQFSNIFEKYPSKSATHLYGLSSSLMKSGKWKEAKQYYFPLLKLKPSLKNFVLPFYCYLKRV